MDGAMGSSLPGHFSAAQVGTYFVSKYYQILQSRPDLVHQFYYDGSTMIRIDGDTAEAATGLQQIHNVIMSLNYTGIEIKTAHSLASWNEGVLVMISGFVQTRDYTSRRKFVQTFFLAPQEKGFFVLNDIFQFLEEEQMHHYTTHLLSNNNYHNKLNTSSPEPEQVTEYMLGGEPPSRDFTNEDFDNQVHVEEEETVDKFSIPDQSYSIPEQPQEVVESQDRVEQLPADETIANTVWETAPAQAEESVAEQPKHTYASILRVAKGQSGQPPAHAPTVNRSAPSASELHHAQQPSAQQSFHMQSFAPEKHSTEAVEEAAPQEEEVDSKSVYLGNLPPSLSASDLEQEFKKFGRIRPSGVTVRSRKETGVFYAFVEFEDSVAVQNALKASPVIVNGQQIYVEGRRPNSGLSRARRGRGRGAYQSDGQRGRFGGRTYGRVYENEVMSRARGNGYAPRGLRQDRGILGNHVSRNGQQYESSS